MAHLQSRSTRSLLSNLTNGRPTLAYDALLDLTGEFRLHDAHHDIDVKSLLDDTVIEMCMYGRMEDANNLRALCTQCSSEYGGDIDTVMLLLLLCSQNVDKKQRTLPPISVFGLDKLTLNNSSPSSIVSPLNFMQPDKIPNIFHIEHDPDLFTSSSSPLLRRRLSSSDSSSSSPPKDRFDCLADSARFIMEEQSQQEIKQRNEKVYFESSVLQHILPSYSRAFCRFLDFVKYEFGWHQHRTNPLKLISESLKLSRPSHQPPERDTEFLYYILCRCVSDPDVDSHTTGITSTIITTTPNNKKIVKDTTTARSPLASIMLQETDVFEEEIRRAHTNRMKCIHRRRTAMKDRINSYTSSQNVTSKTTDLVSDLILRSSSCGVVHRDLVSFAEAYTITTSLERRSLYAIAEFTYRFSRAYFQSILSVANDNNTSNNDIFKRTERVVNDAEMFIADGSIIAEILTKVETTDGSAVDVIDVLMQECENYGGGYGSNETLMQLFYVAVTPYFDYIIDWLFEGSLRRDLGGEFFATILGTSPSAPEQLIYNNNCDIHLDDGQLPPFPNILSTEEVMFLIRAGRGRNLLNYFGLNRGTLAERPDDVMFGDVNVCYEDVMTCFRDLADRVEGFAEEENDNKGKGLNDRIEDDKRIIDYDDDSVSPAWKKVRGGDFDVATGRRRRIRHKVCKHEDEIRFIDGVFVEETYESDSPACVRCLAFRIPSVDDNDDKHDKIEKKLFSNENDNGNDNENPMMDIFSCVISEDGIEKNNRVIVDVNGVMPATQHRARFPLGCKFISELLKPLARIDTVVQREVLRHFIQELQLFEHFKRLRAYVLLGAGDFANELIEQMEMVALPSLVNHGYGSENERMTRERAHFNQCLKTALNLCNSAVDCHTDLLYVDSQFNRRISSDDGKKNFLWDCNMEMKYDVGYPLNIIICDDSMKLYSKIFGLFLKVLRAQKSLRWMFIASRYKRSNGNNNDNNNNKTSGKIWQFCWYAQHFVSIFGGFVMEEVLGNCWEEFKSKWKTVNSIWELKDVHSLFLEGCIRKCLLGERHRSVLKVMTGGFEIVVNVEKEILKLNNDHNTTNVMDLLTSATASLKRRCAFLTDVLERLLDAGTLPHLEYLLTRLNFNHYYES